MVELETASSAIVERQMGEIPFNTRTSFRICEIEGKGRGVLTMTAIAEGNELMCDPVERYSSRDAIYLAKHNIYDHFFVDPAHYGMGGSVDLLWVIGPISIINHAKTPNCRVKWIRDGAREWALLIAVSDIAAGSELLISYTNIDEYDGFQNFV